MNVYYKKKRKPNYKQNLRQNEVKANTKNEIY